MSARAHSQKPRLVVLLRRLCTAPDVPAPGFFGGCERAALDMALALCRELDGTLTALALGAEDHEVPMLCAALAAGCERALCVTTALAAELDYPGVAEILAAAVNHVGCDMLLCGDRSQEERQGIVGPAVAERLDIPHLTGVVAARAGDEPGTVIAAHRSGGREHRFCCRRPVTLCVLHHAGANTTAAGEAADTVDAGRVERMTLDQLGVERSGLSSAITLDQAPGRKPGQVFGSAVELVSRLVDDRVLR